MQQPRDLEWEANQIDKALDFVNVVFGALFGAYIGIELSKGSLSFTLLVNIVLILMSLTIALFNYRVSWHIMAGTIDAPIIWNIVAIIGSCLAMGSIIHLTNFNKSFFVVMLSGWLITSVVMTIGYIIKRVLHD